MGIRFWKSFLFFAFMIVFSARLFPSQRETGLYYALSQQFDRARFYLAKQFHMDPGDTANSLRYLKALNYEAEYGRAEKVAKALVRQYPGRPPFRRALAEFYEDQMRFNEAVPHWEVLVRLRPADTETEEKLLAYYIYEKELEKLISFYEERLRNGRLSFERLMALGDLYLKTSQYGKAEKLYLFAAKAYPEKVDVLSRLAELYEYQGDVDRALPFYRKMADLHPRRREYSLKLAEKLIRYGRAREALSWMDGLAEKFPRDKRIMMSVAGYYIELEEKDRALALLESLYRNDYENPELLETLAFLYGDLKHYSKAIELLERLHEKTDGHYSTYHRLGDYRAAVGDAAGSRREYEKALRLIRTR